MIVAITGTPGTGKTEVAKALSRKLGWYAVSLNQIAKEEGLYKGYDKERMVDIVDIEKLKEEVRILGVSHRDVIIEAHYAHEMPSDVVIVLRTEPSLLRKRMIEKKFWESKIAENLEAEITDVIAEEARQLGKNVYEIDTTKRRPDQTAKEIVKIIKSGIGISSDLKVPEGMKPRLRQHFGELVRGEWKQIINDLEREIGGEMPMTISVGDHCSYHLIENGFVPDIIVIDNVERRSPFEKEIKFDGMEVKIKNKAGTISLQMWKALEKIIREHEAGERIKLVIDGEEDLAALPCMIFAPDGSYVFYGMFDQGMMKIVVSEKVKREALKVLHEIQEKQF
jgi:adenylate kinase